jgi:hypothetical protein
MTPPSVAKLINKSAKMSQIKSAESMELFRINSTARLTDSCVAGSFIASPLATISDVTALHDIIMKGTETTRKIKDPTTPASSPAIAPSPALTRRAGERFISM